MSSRARLTIHAIAAFLACAAIVAAVLVFILPAPQTRMGHLPNFGQLVLLTLAGPMLFAWAWGPGPLGIVGLLVAVVVPVASIGTLFFGFVRRKSYIALASAAVIWSVFGGFCVFVAVMGSV